MTRSSHVLIVDDDAQIRRSLANFLGKHGLRVTQVADGPSMFDAISKGKVDAVLMDIMLPGEDGLALCRRLRAQDETPVLFMTALSTETDRILGLEIGADDYICKPFNPRELLARLRAVLRRTSGLPSGTRSSSAAVLIFDGWSLNIQRRTLRSPHKALVELTGGEFELLQAFVEHSQTVLSRDQLLDLARGRSSVAFDRSIDVQVMRLRRKIEPNPAQPTVIQTVRNGGYIFTASVTSGVE